MSMGMSNNGGGWSLYSESDDRWNCNGSTDSMYVTGGMVHDAKERLELMKKLYGDPPEDLEYSCMKY